MVLGKLDNHIQKNKVGPFTLKNIQKWTQSGLKTQTSYNTWNSYKIPRRNIGENIHDIGLGNGFLDMIPKPQEIKAKLDKWD